MTSMTSAATEATMVPKVSVLIISWNRKDYIRETLQDLRDHQEQAMEVVVVDNGSTDGAAEMIEREFPEVRLVKLPDNLGQCAALNLGLAEAKAEIVISLDNDATLERGAADRILAVFRNRPSLAVVQGKIIDFDTREEIWWWDWYGLDRNAYSEREFSTPWKICEGMCAVRRTSVLDVGGFPPEYFIMDAGRDLAIKLIEANQEIIYRPDVAFFHKSSAEREKTDRYRLHSGRRMYFKLRNELWTVWKYYPWHQVVAKTAMKMCTWGVVMARQGSFRWYLRAMVDAYKGLPVVARNRRPVRPETLRLVEYSRFRALKHLPTVMSWYYVVGKRAG